MNHDFVQFVLLVLMLLVGGNLWLTFRLIRTIKYLRLSPSQAAVPLPQGSVITRVPALSIADPSAEAELLPEETPTVFLYLSSGCDKCKGKLPELNQMCALADFAGVQLCFITAEPVAAFLHFLSLPALKQRGWQLSQPDYDHLNPQGATPFYQFIDEQGVLQTDGFIGDENWQGFVEQIQEMDRQAS